MSNASCRTKPNTARPISSGIRHLPLTERNTLSRLHPDVFPGRSARQREERRTYRDGGGSRRTHRNDRGQRQDAASRDRDAPEQRRIGATPDRVDGQFVMSRRAGRQHVLEEEDEHVEQQRAREDPSQQGTNRIAGLLQNERREEERRRARRAGLCDEVDGGMRPLPEITPEPLREQEARVGRREERQDNRRPRYHGQDAGPAKPSGHEPQGADCLLYTSP